MGKFVISRTKNGGFMFNLLANNGEIIATSEVYTQKPKCKVGIASVQKNCGAEIENQTEKGYAELSRPKYQVYKDKRGEFRFRLVATNGRTIAVGEGYKAMKGCLNGIESIRKNAPEAAIEDQSLVRKSAAEKEKEKEKEKEEKPAKRGAKAKAKAEPVEKAEKAKPEAAEKTAKVKAEPVEKAEKAKPEAAEKAAKAKAEPAEKVEKEKPDVAEKKTPAKRGRKPKAKE